MTHAYHRRQQSGLLDSIESAAGALKDGYVSFRDGAVEGLQETENSLFGEYKRLLDTYDEHGDVKENVARYLDDKYDIGLEFPDHEMDRYLDELEEMSDDEVREELNTEIHEYLHG